MHRNFGVRRAMFGEELFRSYWHDNDNEPESRWPIVAIVGAVVLIAVIGIFA